MSAAMLKMSPEARDPAYFPEAQRGSPIHWSLIRPELTLGIERHVVGVEATLCFALLFGVRFSLTTLALVAFVAFVIHPVMVWLTSHDPQATQVYARSHRYADFYSPHAAVNSPTRITRRSIPRVR